MEVEGMEDVQSPLGLVYIIFQALSKQRIRILLIRLMSSKRNEVREFVGQRGLKIY